MTSLVVLGRDGSYNKKIDSFGIIQGLDFHDMLSRNNFLSWEDWYIQGTYQLHSKTPEIITLGQTKIHLKVGWYSGRNDVLMIRIESRDPSELAEAIEKTILYIGGRTSVFDADPARVNSFVGGIANDFRRMRNAIRDWWRTMQTPM